MTGPSPTASSGDAMCLEMFSTARGMMVCRRVEDHPEIDEDGIGHSVSSLDLPGYHNEKVAFQVKALIERKVKDEHDRVLSALSDHLKLPLHRLEVIVDGASTGPDREPSRA